MPKHRLGVALVLPAPAAAAVDALRLAAGDGSLERIPAHLTLVPPVNVRADALDTALAVLRSAAAAVPPLRLALGPPATFLPDNPVLFLGVGGDVGGIARLRSLVFRPPLERTLAWPFVPHVTLADELAPDRAAAAADALEAFRLDVTLSTVELLEEQVGEDGRRRWAPIADARLGGPDVVGRGGLEVELHPGRVVPPDAVDVVDDEAPPWRPDALVVVARRGGATVGVASGRLDGGLAHLDELAVAADARGEGVGAHLVRAVEREAQSRGASMVAGPAHPFLVHQGWRPAGDLAVRQV